MKRDRFSRPEKLDAHITELIQGAQQQQNMAGEPELRMTDDLRRAYQAEVREDARSLERVVSPFVDDGAIEDPRVIFHQVEQKRERILQMQNATDVLSRDVPRKTKSRWGRRVGL